MRVGSYFSHCFTLYGMGIDRRSKKSQWLNRVCLLNMLLFSTYILVLIFYERVSNYHKFQQLYVISVYLILSVYFNYNRTSMVNFLTHLESHLSLVDIKHLGKYMIFYLGYHWLLVIGNRVVYGIIFGHDIEREFVSWFPILPKDTPIVLKYVLFYWCNVLYYDIVELFVSLMIFYYVYQVHVITVIKMNFLDQIKNKPMVINLWSKWRDVHEIERDFEELYSILPLLRFSDTFMYTVTYLLRIIQKSWSDEISNYVIVKHLIVTLSTFYVVIVIDYSNKKLRRKMDTLLRFKPSQEMKDILSDIDRNIEFRLTACGLFSLDKKLILGFVSSLVTFTVLFIQL